MTPRKETPTFTLENAPRERSYDHTITYGPQPRTKMFWFSPTELKHLLLSTLLVTGVGLSLFMPGTGMVGVPSDGLDLLLSLAVVFTAVYLLHELAHKFVAQHYGLWAEFRLTMFGALLTLLSIFSPIKLISPGAVLIAGPMSRDTAGKAALAGPLMNLILSFVSLALLAYPVGQFVTRIALVGAAFNAWIALFNLVPFAIMDGLKVFRWNKLVWAAAFAASMAVTILTFFMLGY
jgi:Zn-dependent protease